MPPEMFFNSYALLIELIYSLVVVISCSLIYFKTTELYELTSHKGVKYFRNTFLFFGIASFIRLLMHFTRTLRIEGDLFWRAPFGMPDVIFLVMTYFSSVALIYMIYSIFWKRIDKSILKIEYIPHVIAVVIVLLSLITRTPFIFLISQLILFVLLIFVLYSVYSKDPHEFSHFYVLYLIIFSLWIISNFFEALTYFSPEVGLIVYIIAIPLFLTILFKVLKKLNPQIK